jgi:hypothetical protein
MSEKEEVISIEEMLTQAELIGDETKLNELLLPDFKGINYNGLKIDKKGFIAGLCQSNIKMDALIIKDLDIDISNSIATVIGKSLFTIKLSEQIYNLSAQYMDIWQKIDNKWKLKASSVTPIKT